MKITKAELLISAVSQKQYPNERLPELALAGRSNVGKSSFINKMINRKNLAHTSSKPGKTRILNFYNINDTFLFVDVPGYGYAKVSKKERAKWGTMMETYFETRRSLKAVLLITDIRHDPTELDVQMYHYVKYFHHPVIVIATKSDKISKGRRDEHLQRAADILQLHPDDIVIPFSAKTGDGKEIAWRNIKKYI
ncbi:MAG TPA: ribosome biogenesis GTP-binding protein YihA/YsxC [Bacillota bacterium]|nr:ribosome biogenesis GTP-binding protein YihA/YsxC [Bacillota bacterium]